MKPLPKPMIAAHIPHRPAPDQARKPGAKKALEVLKIQEKRLTISTKYGRISIETNREGQQPRRPKLKLLPTTRTGGKVIVPQPPRKRKGYIQC